MERNTSKLEDAVDSFSSDSESSNSFNLLEGSSEEHSDPQQDSFNSETLSCDVGVDTEALSSLLIEFGVQTENLSPCPLSHSELSDSFSINEIQHLHSTIAKKSQELQNFQEMNMNLSKQIVGLQHRINSLKPITSSLENENHKLVLQTSALREKLELSQDHHQQILKRYQSYIQLSLDMQIENELPQNKIRELIRKKKMLIKHFDQVIEELWKDTSVEYKKKGKKFIPSRGSQKNDGQKMLSHWDDRVEKLKNIQFSLFRMQSQKTAYAQYITKLEKMIEQEQNRPSVFDRILNSWSVFATNDPQMIPQANIS